MQPDYIKLQLREDVDRQAWKKYMPESLRYWLYYQPSKMQIEMEDMGDFNGLLVKLPCSMEDIDSLREEWFRQYLMYLGNHYGVRQSACFMDKAIQNRFGIKEEAFEKPLKMLLLREAAQRILHKRCIPYRQAKLVVIDDGSKQAEYVIQDMAKDANYLTVVTHRCGELKCMVEEIFQNHGLAIQMMTDKDVSTIKGDVVVNLISDKEKITTRISGGCDLFDFGYTDQKALRLNQINTNIRIYHTMKIKSVGTVLPLPRLSQIFYYKDDTFQAFVKGNFDKDMGLHFNRLWDSSFIEMVKVF